MQNEYSYAIATYLSRIRQTWTNLTAKSALCALAAEPAYDIF